jgi:YHS domain-containing protein
LAYGKIRAQQILEGAGEFCRIMGAITNKALPMKRMKYLTAAVLTAKLKPYTLKTCVVSGDKLDEMGEPFVYKYQGREIKFCCKNCLKDFNKEPAKYVKKIEKEEAKAKK